MVYRLDHPAIIQNNSEAYLELQMVLQKLSGFHFDDNIAKMALGLHVCDL